MSSTPIDATIGLSKLIQNASALQIATSIIVILLGRWIARAVYRIYFHPLSKFPGPKWHIATRIPQILAIVRGKPHKRVGKIHREYGSIVRIAPDEISFIEPEAWRDIYGHSSKATPGSLPHKQLYRNGTSVSDSPSLIVANDVDHPRMRRIFNPAFSDRALKKQEPLFRKYVDLLATKIREGIQEEPERKFDMVRMYNFTTFDIMGDLAFGEPLHMLANAEYDPWVQIIFKYIRTATRLSVIDYYPLMRQLFSFIIPKSVMKKRKEHFNFAATRVTKRLAKGVDSEGMDLWDLVLSQPEGKGLTRGEMDSNASLFMLAGTETTATLTSGLTFLLLKHPSTMQALTKEIRESFSDPEEMTIEKVAALRYLNACIKEAFRLYPPVVAGLPRTTPQDGSTICGQFVPPGFTVSISQLIINTSASNFKDPLSFIPDRWLGDERFENDQRSCVQPFSVGQRDCMGKNMAYHEMRLIMSKLLYTFDLQLCPESNNWADQDVYKLWEKKPLMCTLKAVN